MSSWLPVSVRRARPNSRMGALLACLLCLGSLIPMVALADKEDETTSDPVAYKVKAAYLYNFTRLIEWPEESLADPEAPLRVCIVGEDPFGSMLDPMTERKAKGRGIAIERMSRGDDYGLCHLLFISASEDERLPQILSMIGDRPALTVSDLTDFASQGGIIGFVIRDGKVRFEINLKRAREVGIRISARLLKIAMLII